MDMDDYLKLANEALMLSVFVAGPILLLGLAAGLIISIFQAATQINDAALAFLPKILATIIGMALFGNFMLNRLVSFTTRIYTQIGTLGN